MDRMSEGAAGDIPIARFCYPWPSSLSSGPILILAQSSGWFLSIPLVFHAHTHTRRWLSSTRLTENLLMILQNQVIIILAFQ